MTDNERMAIAILRSGGSYADAMEQTKLTMEHLQTLWSQHGKPNPANTQRIA